MLQHPIVYVLGIFGLALGWAEVLVIAGIGVIVFGKRLPEVGKSVGKSIVEFKKGLQGIQDEVRHADSQQTPAAENETEPEPKDSAMLPRATNKARRIAASTHNFQNDKMEPVTASPRDTSEKHPSKPPVG